MNHQFVARWNETVTCKGPCGVEFRWAGGNKMFILPQFRFSLIFLFLGLAVGCVPTATTVVVPAVVGETQAVAEAAITSAGLSVSTVTEAFSDSVAEGRVISQFPASGSSVVPGTGVDLVVSRGIEPVVVPAVVGETQAAAEAAITGGGLSIGTVTEAFSDSVAAGLVISQSPIAGSSVAPGTGVALVVSKGIEPVVVPAVVGETQAAAEAAITGAGLSMGTVTEAFSDSVAAGLVITQSPSAGSSVAPGTGVDLVVSKGTQKVSVPDVVGELRANAVATIVAAGLSVATVTEAVSYTVPLDHVISQSPVAGTSVALGAGVNLLISRGAEEVSVPDVVGERRDNAEVALTDAGLSVGTVTEVFNETVGATRVISQSPMPGTSVSTGTSVDLVISKGREVVEVPIVRFMTQADAEATITDAGLSVGTISYAFSETVEEGLAIETFPSYGVRVPGGAEVELVISKRGTPILSVNTNGVNLSQSSNEATVEVTNIGEGTLRWVATSNDPAVTVSPGEQTANNFSATISTEDFSESYIAQVTFMNEEGLGEIEVVDVNVKDASACEECIEETIMLPGDVPLTMMSIPPGFFQMGRVPGEQDSHREEDPRHPVRFSSGFWLGKYEVTKEQWEAVMGTTPWTVQIHVLDDANSPAVCVSWHDAQAFISELNDYTGLSFRLPSEAEWEYACRAGTTTRFHWGDDPDYSLLDAYGWWDGNTYYENKRYGNIVGQKLANPLGLHDMTGNVGEWCQDTYHFNYVDAPGDGSAWEGPITGIGRMTRGGDYHAPGQYCRSASRSWRPAEIDYQYDVGFRLAR
jgi:beta-lactam-binding protein with PASTA domain/formylglycine-generating enzyme required for sulfatase activity